MARGKGQYQIVGDEQKLSHKPVSSPSANPKSGQSQLVGDSVSLSRTPVQSPSANPRSGQFDLVGDTVSLNRTPVKGWGSAANLPMSERAIQQSNTAAGKGGKKK
jgi:hypothetical protein